MQVDLKGRIVIAPLMGRSTYGLVVDVFEKAEGTFRKAVKELQAAEQYQASETDLQFLKWLSSYYTTSMGIALKSGFFEEIVAAMKKCGGALPAAGDSMQPGTGQGEGDRTPGLSVNGCITGKTYKSFLFHAPSLSREYAFLLETLERAGPDMRGIIILVPEIGHIGRVELLLKERFGQRLCIFHSKLGKGKRVEAVRRILAGEADIVVGTRSAVLAPLKELSFIAVTGEHSFSYKGEEGLKYQARDVAVMRGFMEKRPVLLTSICPSVESIYNLNAGKYITVSAPRELPGGGITARPGVKLIGMTREKSGNLSLSEEVVKEARRILSGKGKILFLINRKGYSLIMCEDCGYVVKCAKCSMSLVFHKKEGKVKCHYCGYSEQVPDTCVQCRGTAVKPFGIGTERVKEEVEGLLGAEALLIEKAKGSPKVTGKLPADLSPFVIGTAYAAGRVKDESFSAAAFLNVDVLLSQPDFRAYERSFQELLQVSQLVSSGGRIFMQTRMPKDKVLRFIRTYDFDGFYQYELSQRKLLGYPPFSKIILLNIFAKSMAGGLLDNIQAITGESGDADAELLGPVEVPSALKSHRHCIQVLVKSKDSKNVHSAARNILNKLEEIKGLTVRVDVDPLKI